MLKVVLVPINRAGYPFIAIFAAVAIALYIWWTPAGVLGALLTAWCVYFFRDPDRITPVGEDLVISPADGVVQSIVKAVPPPELNMGSEPRTRIAVFMNVFNVHVNRNPCDGTVIALAYRPGRFFNASFDKASEHNERMAAHIRTRGPDGGVIDLAVVQIAGLVARRIKSDLVEGQEVSRGERYGIIRFGSRLDVYLPQGIAPLVVEGQHVIAGETKLADLMAGGAAIEGQAS